MPVAEPKHRRVGRPRGLTLAQDLGQGFREALRGLSVLSFPAIKYQQDILGFAEDVLGFTPCYTLEQLVAIRDDEDARGVPEDERRKCLWPKQIEILLEVQSAVHSPTDKRVAVASGHKIGKSHTASIIGLWFYSCFADAKVVFSSTTAHQVKTILWDEFRKTRWFSKIPIPGDMHELPSSGFISEDFRTARGFTAREPEAVAGISGRNLLFLLDEASGIPDDIHEAVAGNMAGSATLVMFSNPTRTLGTFFDAFNDKADFYRTFQISSEETPNALTGRRLIPGLATRPYVDEMREEWGEDSPFFKIRVKGQFVLADEGKPFSAALIAAAEEAWPDAQPAGPLQIGVDPAGAGDGGDETGFSSRRGPKVLKLYARAALNEDGILAEVLGLLKDAPPDSEAVVTVDREGPIGFKVYSRLRAHFEESKSVRVIGVRASDRAIRRPDQYDRVRDELWGNLEAWLKAGGALPTDRKLEKELYTIEWATNLQGRLKATPKDDIRKLLQRSPDRADALALSVWEPSSHRVEQGNEKPVELDPYREPQTRGLDPYAALDVWRT